jgi:hypothetical protein
MNRHPDVAKKYQAALLALLGLAIFAPVLLRAAPLAWLPDWLGAAIAVAALLGAFIVFWRAGAMRIGYVVLFAVALALAAAFGLYG